MLRARFTVTLTTSATIQSAISCRAQELPACASTPIGGVGPVEVQNALALSANASLPSRNNGFIGGGQIGYNYQFANSWVVGIEADIQGLANSDRSATTVTFVQL